jgi:hypothetical protein
VEGEAIPKQTPQKWIRCSHHVTKENLVLVDVRVCQDERDKPREVSAFAGEDLKHRHLLVGLWVFVQSARLALLV